MDRERIALDLARWHAESVKPSLERSPERKPGFRSSSGFEIKRLYTPLDTPEERYGQIGLPATPAARSSPKPRSTTWPRRAGGR